MTCAKIRKNISNSAGDCSISLKFCTDFDHVTPAVPRTLKVNVLKFTTWHNVSGSENAIIQARISCRRSNLVKIVSETSAKRYISFKVIRSNIEIGLTPPRIARLRSNLIQSFITSLRRSRSFKVPEFGTNRKLICDFLLVINTNLPSVLHRFPS